MTRPLTTAALAVWLTVAGRTAVGQEGTLGYPPATDVYAGPVRLQSLAAAPTQAATAPAQAPVEMTRARSEWSLGDYGPTPREVAPDLNPPGQTLGWYAGAEIGILKPHLKGGLTTPSGFSGPSGGPIALPLGSLDWTGVPQIHIGYRFDQGAGELRLSYRLIASTGSDSVPGFGDATGPASLRTRLNVQSFDLDYIMPEFLSEGRDVSRWFFRELQAGVGLRAASAFFDTNLTGGGQPNTRARSSFGGVGPRAFVELRQDLGRPDVQFYSRVSGAGLIGPVNQQFSQTGAPDGSVAPGFYGTGDRHNGIGVLQAEAGISWCPNVKNRRWRLTAAYSWERWWNFGRTDDSQAELTLQGAILRAEFRY